MAKIMFFKHVYGKSQSRSKCHTSSHKEWNINQGQISPVPRIANKNRESNVDNRTRVITALNHKQPDKVPYHIWMNEAMKQKMAQYCGDSEFESKLGNCFCDAGNYANNYTQIEKGIWQDRFGVLWDRSVEKEMGNVCNCMVNPQNLEQYELPDSQACIQKTIGKERIVCPAGQFSFLQLGFSLYERAWTLGVMENVLMAMVTNEGFADRLFDRIMEFNLAWIERAGVLEIDAIFFGDDWGQQTGLIMGPDLWRKFIKPRFVRMCQAVKDKGKYVFLHSCGKVQEIFPDLIECGVDMFNPFQPEVMDVFQIKKQYGKDLSFFGGISLQNTLPFGTVSQTRDEVKRLLDIVGEDGGYVAGPAHSIPEAKVENVAAMIDVLQNQ